MDKKRIQTAIDWDWLWVAIPVLILLGGIALVFWLMVHVGDTRKANCIRQAQNLKATDYYYDGDSCTVALNGKIVRINVNQ